MNFLVSIILFEIIISSCILGLASNQKTLIRAKHQVSAVLGIENTYGSEDNTTSNDTTQTVQSENNSIPSNPTTTKPTETDLDQQTSVPTEINPADTNNSPAASNTDFLENSGNSSANQSNRLSPSTKDSAGSSDIENIPNSSRDFDSSYGLVSSPSPNSAENGDINQAQAILNPDDLINSTENINSQSLNEAKYEDDRIDSVKDIKEQNELLITFATDKIKDMNNFSRSNDFSSTNFAVSRFNDQIDKVIKNLDKLPKNDQTKLKQQLTNFCIKADQFLRTVGLLVPQEYAQDIQITRGQCKELQL